MEDSQLIGNTINFVLKKKEKPKKVNEKFKVTEILFVLSAVGVVVFLALLAINPSKEAAEARNLKRSADISTILTYVSAYTRTNRDIPEEIPISDKCVYFTHEICKTGPYNCIDLVDMSFLTEESSDQLVIMPTDPYTYLQMVQATLYLKMEKEMLLYVLLMQKEMKKFLFLSICINIYNI